MNRIFRRLPLLTKLMIIGMIPLLFAVYLTVQLYHEKSLRVDAIERQMNRISQSAEINELIDDLQEERKYSFDYTMTGSMRDELLAQRPKTDAIVQKLKQSGNRELYEFGRYTKLNGLGEIRSRIDSGKAPPNDVMHFYSNMVFRLNTMNVVPYTPETYSDLIYQDLTSQKLLSEMMTYLGIIRSNIYNVLHTRKYMLETLFGTVGTHDVYMSYEQEFQLKASPHTLAAYNQLKNSPALHATLGYIDTLFKRFSFDSTYDAKAWWSISNEGIDSLRKFQKRIWSQVNSNLNGIYNSERSARNLTIIFLAIAISLVMLVIVYSVHILRRMLRELEQAAEKIAEGETDVMVRKDSDDAIGRLAVSIEKIDRNNKELASAAGAIGEGYYSVEVVPRSKQDLLGNAIVEMKQALQRYSEKMESLVTDRTEALNRSNEDLQQFAHVASHDLREPLRKISTFSGRLDEELKDGLNEKGKIYLEKIQSASNRMYSMVEGVLNYSMVEATTDPFTYIDLNTVMNGVAEDLELVIQQKGAQLEVSNLPGISGIPVLIHQLFYNLINNALKFTNPDVKPHIRVYAKEVSREDLSRVRNSDSVSDLVHIVVEDNGIGFAEKYAEQMFLVFTRLNSREAFEGTGLGLALCKKIVLRHRGHIYATGEEGRGASFHLLLPGAKQEAY